MFCIYFHLVVAYLKKIILLLEYGFIITTINNRIKLSASDRIRNICRVLSALYSIGYINSVISQVRLPL